MTDKWRDIVRDDYNIVELHNSIRITCGDGAELLIDRTIAGQFLDDLAWVMRADGWVSVTEALPEHEERWDDHYQYTVYTSNRRVTVAESARWRRQHRWAILDKQDEYESVTHWQPLPPPPQQD